MKNQHTPGPWQALIPSAEYPSTSKSITIYIGLDDDGGPSAEVYGKDREANARLMAAAPDLLAVAQRLAAWGSMEIPSTDANLANIIHDALAAIPSTEGGEE
jgi:hypothetical protein